MAITFERATIVETRRKNIATTNVRALMVALLVPGLSWGMAAQAQTQAQQPPGAVGTPQPRQERPDERTPSTIAAENYDPKGVPVGSFRFFPALTLEETFNDNIYATPYGQPGRLASFIQTLKPVLDLRSNWNNHMLQLFATGNIAFYSASALENYQDFSLGTNGRLDIQRNWNVYGGFSFNRAHEDRGTPNDNSASNEPNKYNQITGNVGYYQKVNRFSARAEGRLDNYAYINPGAGPAFGDVWNYDRNRTEFRESLRLGFEFSPAVTVWTRGGLNQRNYNYQPDSLGFYRNSSGWDITGGVAVDLTGITSFEAWGGYLMQNYVDSRFPQISAPTFGLTGYWLPLKDLTIKPFVQRTVQESASTTATSYLNTSVGVDAEYKVKPDITLAAHADYAWVDYNATQGSQVEKDQYLTLRASATYNITRNFFTGLSYQFVNRTSNLINNDYGQNVVMLRLGARL